jgi:hypothetical protein
VRGYNATFCRSGFNACHSATAIAINHSVAR